MDLLKRLIFKEWFKFFFAATLVLFLVLSVGNLISGLLRSNVTAFEVLMNYIIELPGFFSKIFPVASLIASLFSINKLKNRNELTAIFASGFSRKQFTSLIFIASFLVSLIQFCTGAYLDPFIKRHRNVFIPDGQKKFRNLKSKGLKSSTIKGGRNVWYKSGNYYFSFSTFDKQNNILRDVSFYFYDKNYMLAKKISAQKAIYDRSNLWNLQNVTFYSQLNKSMFPNVSLAKNHVIQLRESPSDFKKIESDITTLNIVDLYQYISKLKKSGINTNEYEVDFWNVFASSLICIIFALMSATSAFNPNRRNSSFGKNIIFVFVFTIMYWLASSYFLELGKSSQINSLTATFTIPIMFSIILSGFFYLNRKLR